MNTEEKTKLIALMLDKSQDSAMLAIEIFNKPTLKFKTEAFVYLICNAWELLLKAHLLNIGKNIYYFKNSKKTNRTLSINDCVKSVFTNDKDPLRINLETIISIRNASTHLIIQEYAILMSEYFIACLKNYNKKLLKFFNINLDDRFPSAYIAVQTGTTLKTEDLSTKYTKEIVKKFLATNEFMTKSIIDNSDSTGTVSDSLAVTHRIAFKKVSKIEDADVTLTTSKSSGVSYVEVVKSFDEIYPLKYGKLKEIIKDELKKNNTTFTPVNHTASNVFNSHLLNLYISKHSIKQNGNYARLNPVHNAYQYTHSLAIKIVEEITTDPDIFIKLKQIP